MDYARMNPWWGGKEHVTEDKHLKDYAAKRYQWKPAILDTLHLEPNNIFSLRGPRQVGKTTLVKLLIQKLLQKYPEKAVFYWNCDELVDFRELASVLRDYLSFSQDHQQKFIFLDEISRIKQWQRAIKSMTDSGELEGCCIFLTGSHTLDIKYGIERLPGRIGAKGKDMILLPMSFSSYLRLVAPELAQEKIALKSSQQILQAAQRIAPFSSQIHALFKQYLITGGFPLVVNEYAARHSIPDYVFELYFQWIVGDIVKWGKQEKIVVQLMKAVLEKQAAAISWDGLAKDAELKSHKTVSSYIEILENMFALLVLNYINIPKKTADFSKNKKIYFIDPFIFHIFNKKLYFKEQEITPALVEGTILSHLARLQGGAAKLYYWKNGREVDGIVQQGTALFPVEVKYQNRISGDDYRGLHYFKQGILASKNTMEDKGKYVTIPAHLLLAVLDEEA
ncbi:ATP-binding protein [Candidatus Woesearchaeota archaeon]|nr:ATP-binding protein [Candidatus Woesearchaeota archaeon]